MGSWVSWQKVHGPVLALGNKSVLGSSMRSPGFPSGCTEQAGILDGTLPAALVAVFLKSKK